MTQLTEFFGQEGRLAKCLKNFESREGQLAMAEAVAEVLLGTGEKCDDKNIARVLVVEAETGIGKTLAYLIPAALSGKRVVVSTATLNLQDQIIDKDLPLVEKVLKKKSPRCALKVEKIIFASIVGTNIARILSFRWSMTPGLNGLTAG